MTDTVPVTLKVGRRELRARASRDSGGWTLVADYFPEHPVTGKDLGELQGRLVRLLSPKCAAIEAGRR